MTPKPDWMKELKKLLERIEIKRRAFLGKRSDAYTVIVGVIFCIILTLWSLYN